MSTVQETPGIPNRLDSLRWSRAHTVLVFGLGAGWMFDSLEVNLVASVINPLEENFNVTYVEGQFVFFSWLIGVLLGALFGGALADRFGRRRLFLATLIWYAGFTVLTGLAPNLWTVVILRFITALGVGAEYSIITSAISEMVPAKHRGKAAAVVMAFWPLGAIWAGLLGFVLLFTLALPPTVSWRYGFIVGGVLALAILVVRRRIPESPRWLVSQGRHAEAEKIVAAFEQNTTRTRPAPLATPSASPPMRHALRDLVRQYPRRLILGCSLNLSEAFGYYGIFAFLPLIVLPSINIANEWIPFFYIVGNVGALGGAIGMAMVFDRIGRRRTVIGFYLLAAAGVGLLAFATETGSGTWVLLAFVVSNALATGAGASAYPTVTELFPTRLRAAGLGFTVAVGRIGAAFGITLVTFVATSVSITAGYLVVVIFWVIGATTMLIYTLGGGVEGARKPLEALLPKATQQH